MPIRRRPRTLLANSPVSQIKTSVRDDSETGDIGLSLKDPFGQRLSKAVPAKGRTSLRVRKVTTTGTKTATPGKIFERKPGFIRFRSLLHRFFSSITALLRLSRPIRDLMVRGGVPTVHGRPGPLRAKR